MVIWEKQTNKQTQEIATPEKEEKSEKNKKQTHKNKEPPQKE